jgi:hypothetical protein
LGPQNLETRTHRTQKLRSTGGCSNLELMVAAA